MKKLIQSLTACVALAFCAGLAGCSTTSTPPSAEYVAYTTLSESNKAVDIAARAFAVLFVQKENDNEYSKFVAPGEYLARKEQLVKLQGKFNDALESYRVARDAAVDAAIASKLTGTPMETPAMATAAASIAQLFTDLKGGSK